MNWKHNSLVTTPGVKKAVVAIAVLWNELIHPKGYVDCRKSAPIRQLTNELGQGVFPVAVFTAIEGLKSNRNAGEGQL